MWGKPAGDGPTRSETPCASTVCVLPPPSLGVAFLTVAANPTFAQSTDTKATEQRPPAGESGKDGQKKIDEYAEAEKLLGGPAANPECMWLGRRVVSLLWRDDLDTAFRHLDLYDRFGCPAGHIQTTFRCVVRQGNIDPKDAQGTGSATSRDPRLLDRSQYRAVSGSGRRRRRPPKPNGDRRCRSVPDTAGTDHRDDRRQSVRTFIRRSECSFARRTRHGTIF